MSKNKEDIRQAVTDQIISALSRNIIPWRKPWSHDPNSGAPTNLTSKKGYRGVNSLLLDLISMEKGYQSKWWGTYNQFLELGGQVRKGEKGTYIVYYNILEVDDKDKPGKKKKIFFLRNYCVFNLDQVDSQQNNKGEKLNKFRPNSALASEIFDVVKYDKAERIIASTGAVIHHGGNSAFYLRPSPAKSWPEHTGGDFIQVPNQNQFPDQNDYYITIFHELAHWCEIRLDWEDSYEMGELVAEIAACMLAPHAGVPNTNMDNHNKYIAEWLAKMKSDPKWIFKAATQASKVVDFILEFSEETDGENQPEIDEIEEAV